MKYVAVGSCPPGDIRCPHLSSDYTGRKAIALFRYSIPLLSVTLHIISWKLLQAWLWCEINSDNLGFQFHSSEQKLASGRKYDLVNFYAALLRTGRWNCKFCCFCVQETWTVCVCYVSKFYFLRWDRTQDKKRSSQSKPVSWNKSIPQHPTV